MIDRSLVASDERALTLIKQQMKRLDAAEATNAKLGESLVQVQFENEQLGEELDFANVKLQEDEYKRNYQVFK